MPSIPVISGDEMVKIIEKCGFTLSRQKGSHQVYIKQLPNTRLITVIPRHKELQEKTLRSILKQSHIQVEDFLNLYKSI